MISREIEEKINKNAINLSCYCLNDLAWKKEDAINVVRSIMNDEIGILGGDVYKLIPPDRFEPLYYYWACEINEGEAKKDFYERSKVESLEYIQRCPQFLIDSSSVVFSITFTEKVSISDRVDMHLCRVCGLFQEEAPWGDDGKIPTFNICDCCGVEFGCGDATPIAIRQFREAWIESGAHWFNEEKRPDNWNLSLQLAGIGCSTSD